MLRLQLTIEQTDCHHVLQTMIPVCRVMQRTLFGNNANRRVLGGQFDALYLINAIDHLRMQGQGTFHSGLRMEFGGEGYFEQHLLHDIAAIRALKPEGLAIEQYIIKPPLGGTERTGHAHFTFCHHHRQAHRATGRITCCPGFARTRVGAVTIGAQRLAIHPGMGKGIYNLLLIQPQHDC